MSDRLHETFQQGWAMTTLGEITAPSVDQSGPDSEPDFLYVDIGSIDNRLKRILEPKLVPTAQAPSRARQRLRTSDVLVSMTRPNLNAVTILPAQMDGAIGSSGFHVLRADSVDPAYLYYFVQTDSFVEAMSQFVQGALYPAVRPKDIRNYAIPLAPLAEQHRIVGEIENQFSRLAAGVAALKRVQANLKRYRAAVLQAACTGRLVPTEAELARAEGRDYEPADQLLARVLTAQGARSQEEPFLRGGGNTPKGRRSAARDHAPAVPDTCDLASLPEGWDWTNLYRLTSGGPQNGLYLPQAAYGTGSPILRIEDFQSGRSKPSDELKRVNASAKDIEVYGLQQGDLVINRVNSPSHLGKCLLVTSRNLPALFESNMMRLRVCSVVEAAYMDIYLRSHHGRSRLIQNAKWAVNQASINQGDVGRTPVPLPPLAEQHRLVAEVERRLSIIDETEALVETNLKRAERLRQAILKRAFEGRLVPQDPDDEPASVLLERVRSERAALAANGAEKRAGRGTASSAAGTREGGSCTGANRTARQRVLDL
jgi:type I restriction enzyme S subunit